MRLLRRLLLWCRRSRRLRCHDERRRKTQKDETWWLLSNTGERTAPAVFLFVTNTGRVRVGVRSVRGRAEAKARERQLDLESLRELASGRCPASRLSSTRRMFVFGDISSILVVGPVER